MPCTRNPTIALHAIVLSAVLAVPVPAGEAPKKAPAAAAKKVEAKPRPKPVLPPGWTFEIRTLKVSQGDMLPL